MTLNNGHPSPTTRPHEQPSCGRCPTIAACLKYAVDNNVNEGFWGNTSPDERQRMRKA